MRIERGMRYKVNGIDAEKYYYEQRVGEIGKVTDIYENGPTPHVLLEYNDGGQGAVTIKDLIPCECVDNEEALVLLKSI